MSSRDGWRRVRFGEIALNVNECFDREHGPESRVVAGQNISESSLGITDWSLTTDHDFRPTFKRLFRHGDVLLHSRNIEKLGVPDFDGVTGEKIFVLRSRDERELLQEFLPWILVCSGTRDYIARSLAGSVNKFLNWTPLAELQLDLPPIKTQARFAELLTTFEVLLARYSSMATRIGSLSQAHRGRFFLSGSEWESTQLGDVAELQLGKMLSQRSRSGTNPKPYLTNINVRWRSFDLDDLRTMDFTGRELQKFRVEPGDILACEGRGVGRSAVWNGELEECYYQKALHRIRVRGTAALPEYLVEYFAFCSESGRFARLVGDSLIPHLTEVKFKTLPVPLPPLHLQRRFVEEANTLRDATLAVERQATRARRAQQLVIDDFFAS